MANKLTLQPYAKKQIDMIHALLCAELFKNGFSRENTRLRSMGGRRMLDHVVWADKGQHEDIVASFTVLAPTVELILEHPRQGILDFE